MLRAFFRALGQLGDQRIVTLLGASVLLAIGMFAGLWIAVGWLLTHTVLSEWRWLDTALAVLGGFGTLLLTWLLFPAVVSASIGLFLERIAAAVEARHYPGLPRAPGMPTLAAVWNALRFLVVLLALNLLLLPALLLGPVFPVLYYAVNGYLLGREYFELVALRREAPAAARAMRRAHRLTAFGAGLVTAILLTLPLVNFLAPVLTTMAMVHLVEGWRRGR